MLITGLYRIVSGFQEFQIQMEFLRFVNFLFDVIRLVMID